MYRSLIQGKHKYIAIILIALLAIMKYALQGESPSPQEEVQSFDSRAPSSSNATNSTVPLRIQVASDLHIEFYGEKEVPNEIIEPQAPILALVGDIGYACTEQLRQFLFAQTERFEQVLFLAGNHEYYNHGTSYSATEQNEWMKQVCEERENLHFLEQKAMEFNGVMVLGTTLWSDIPDDLLAKSESSLNDYRLSYNHAAGETPRNLKANETTAWFRDNLAWLESQLAIAKQKRQKVVVLTHHTPLLSGTSKPEYEGNDLSHCFSTNLADILHDPIVAWACGHTHYNFDLQVGGVRVVSNQRGYKSRPKDDYQPGGVILEVQSGDY